MKEVWTRLVCWITQHPWERWRPEQVDAVDVEEHICARCGLVEWRSIAPDGTPGSIGWVPVSRMIQYKSTEAT